METKRAGLWKYFLGLSVLVAGALAAQNFSDWSEPVNLGDTINTQFAEQ